ncbi:MAG: hypothetical protein ACRDUT_14250 [Mycobacterium sp.]
MEDVFIGSEALQRGDLTRHDLRRWHRSIYPDVYVAKHRTISLRDNVVGAWLWSGRRAVIAGVAASALHGALWVDDSMRVELIWNNGRPPHALVVRNEQLRADEFTVIDGIPVTNAARTAFDLGRHLRRGTAVARLDALARATGVTAANVRPLAERYKGARGVRRLKATLLLMDGGAQSPKETWLRLLLVDAGLPIPQTQIMVHNGDFYPLAYLDMGWEQFMVAVEYDGDHHQSDRRQYVKDISRLKMLENRGWIVVRVIAEDHPNNIVDRVYRALTDRGLTEIEHMQAVTHTFAA